MINLDSILKSRDITLPTKVCLVKVMHFPVVMYGCESWTVKKAEHLDRSTKQKINKETQTLNDTLDQLDLLISIGHFTPKQ